MATQFVCFRWGVMYPETYIERLYKSIQKHFGYDFVFHCFTDKPLDIGPHVQQHDLCFGKPFSGNWNKERVFSKDFLNLAKDTNIVVMDIDVLVTGNLNFIIEDHPDENLVMAPDKYHTRKGKVHGSVFRLKSGSMPYIWDDLIVQDYEKLKQDLGGEREQKWLDRYLAVGSVMLFSGEKIVSFKYDCKSRGWSPLGKLAAKWGLTTSLWGKAELPLDARVVCFHGKPDIEDVADGRYYEWNHAPFINRTLKNIIHTND